MTAARACVQSKLLADIRTTVALPGDDDKEAAVKVLKKEMNDWTAKYRNSGEGGRPSFSNMYSAVNALAGHWTSFGADAPVPKKRMARITKVRATSLPRPAAYRLRCDALRRVLGTGRRGVDRCVRRALRRWRDLSWHGRVIACTRVAPGTAA